jgi:predicted nucleic acid-binding protein
MPTRILDIGDSNIQIPDFVILDASIVLELRPNISQSNPTQTLALNFLNRLQSLAMQGQVMPLLPLLAFEECLFKICKNEIVSRTPSKSTWEQYYKANPQIILNCGQTLNSFYGILKGFPIVIVEPEDLAVPPINTLRRLADRILEMVLLFKVLPKDATILSAAERLGVDTVVSLDSDWKRADGFTVITIP